MQQVYTLKNMCYYFCDIYHYTSTNIRYAGSSIGEKLHEKIQGAAHKASCEGS